MTFIQKISPNLGQKASAGWCLKFVQDSFRAPVMHATATIAANATRLRSTSRTMPNVAVPVWFWHYGTYGGVSGEYGHVVIWVPGRGFLSSPVTGFGQLWLSSLADVERTFNAKYRFWSLDINTLQVAKPAPDTSTTSGISGEFGDEMFIAKLKNGRWYLVVPNGSGKMRATWLPGQSGASASGIPILNFAKASEEQMKQLRAAVDGI